MLENAVFLCQFFKEFEWSHLHVPTTTYKVQNVDVTKRETS